MAMLPRLSIVLAGLLAVAPAWALPLWSVEGARGTVLLMGSVHLLRAADQPLPAAVLAAYQRANRVVLELDPLELGPDASLAALQRIGVSSPGRSVTELLDATQWRHAESLAASAGMDLHVVAGFEPWFATIALYNEALARHGFDPQLGVDQQLADWAARDGKPVAGLESIDDQLGLFKQLPADVQVEMLLKTLTDLAGIDAEAAGMVAAWRAGDLAQLERWLDDDFEGFELLRTRIVTERNRAWLTDIEALLEQEGTSLVVVGALHLVGPEGVPQLLSERGYQPVLSPVESGSAGENR